ncbi:transposase [Streptomyces sp. NPDC051452]|uniref:transposase n=1 Tax=Streptomyces sp. NPDC051452 TaxID=3365654 RepID=UPI0037B368F8
MAAPARPARVRPAHPLTPRHREFAEPEAVGRGPDTEPRDHGSGRSRDGFSTKLHLAVDQSQKPMAIVVTAGRRGDSPQFEPVLKKVRVPRIGPGRPAFVPTGCGRTRRTSPGRTAPTRRRGIHCTIPDKADQARNKCPPGSAVCAAPARARPGARSVRACPRRPALPRRRIPSPRRPRPDRLHRGIAAAGRPCTRRMARHSTRPAPGHRHAPSAKSVTTPPPPP